MSNRLAQDHLRILLDGETIHQTDQPTQHYKPGQKIKGVASYSPSAEVKVDSMTIIFKATLYSELKDNGQASYGCIRTANQNLFRYEKLILKGPHKVSPKPHEWPFEFELPEKIKVPFVPDLQPVPPTWNVVSVARVVYSLKLCVNPHRKTRYMEIERGINVWPFEHRDLPIPEPETQQLFDPTQNPNWMSRRRSSTMSLTQQLSRRRSSTISVPTPLNLSISIPTRLGAWQKFSIKLLCSSNNDTTSPTSSDYILQTCELSLKAQISYTNSLNGNNNNNNNNEPPLFPVAKFKLLGRGLKLPSDNTLTTIKRDMKLVDMTRGDASLLVPNFSIGASRLEYLLDVCVVVQDSKSGNAVERRVGLPVVILEGGLAEVRREQEDGEEDAPPGFFDSVGPPGYEEEERDGGVWAQGNVFTSPACTVAI